MKKGVFEKNKKSQISVFIIVSLLIVIIVVSYFFVKYNFQNISKSLAPDIQPIYSFVNQCIKETGENAIEYVGLRGGYYKTPNLSLMDIPYYMYEKENYVPEKEVLESEISLYINENINQCINSFQSFQDFQVNQKKIETKTIIENEKVIFIVEYPLSIIKEEKTYELKNFEVDIDSRIGIIHATAKNIIANEIEDAKYICIDCIDYFAEKNNLKVNILHYDDRDVIFTIIDESSKINSKSFIFNFVIRYVE